MKKIFLSFSVAFLYAATSFGQMSDEIRSYIGLNLGTSIPVGKYASTSETEKGAGAATTGFSGSLDGAFLFTPNIGVGFNTGLFTNSMNADILKKAGFSGTTGYANVNYLVGPHFSLPFEKLTLDLRALFGGIYSAGPAFEIDKIYKIESSGSAFAWSVGTGVRYGLSDKFALKFNVDYLASSIKYNQKVTVDNSTRTEAADDATSIGVVNITVGVAYQFVK
jgi:opacity protein-like surface antigen